MMNKGLEALIPKKSEKRIKKSEELKETVFSIEIEKITANPDQPRKNFDQKALESLADSIKRYGILQPLLVNRIEGEETESVKYQLIAGERRLLAAKIAGFIRVPVIIREFLDKENKERLEISLIENIQRLDLNPLEKAEAFKRLQEEFNFLQKDIAELWGKSREAVANTLRILDLSEEIKNSLKEEKITEGHARVLLMVKDPQKQKKLFYKILKERISVRATESLAQKLEIWKPIKRETAELPEKIKDLEEKLKERLGVKKLKISIEIGKPKLTIFFNSKEEIEKIFKKLF